MAAFHGRGTTIALLDTGVDLAHPYLGGRVAPGYAVEPVGVLVAELRTAGERLGVLARMRDLLPGRYALGLTGRAPGGKKVAPGAYVVRVRADPVPGDVGAGGTAFDVPFTIR